jgi:hypothetical protein
MEFNCPDCGKRLRAPDHLPNPLVRCRTCGATFRPREQEGTIAKRETTPQAPARPRVVSKQQQKPFVPAQQPKPQPEWALPSGGPFGRPLSSPAPKPTVRRGLGIGIAILVILLLKAPRLLKLVLPPNQPQPPAPMKIDPMQMQMLRDLQQPRNLNPFQIPPEGPQDMEDMQPPDQKPPDMQPPEPQPESEKPEAEKPEADKPEGVDNPFIQVDSPQP